MPPRTVNDGCVSAAVTSSCPKIESSAVFGASVEMGEHGGDDVLLESGAHLLDERRFDRRCAAVVDRAGDRQRQVVEHPVVGDGVAEQVAQFVATRVGAVAAQQLLDEQIRAQPTVGAAALVGEFGRVLRPSLADLAEHQVVGHEDVIEHDLAEVGACRR